jgi:hypothetical protein
VTVEPEHYASLLEESGLDGESLTVVLVGGADLASAARALGLDLDQPLDGQGILDEEEWSAYALVEVDGGVVAIESTGYADPSLDALGLLSAPSGRAAVVRSNIQAHVRFGCARDGVVVFDDDEYAFTEDPDAVPDELRDLFALARMDLDGDGEADDDADWLGVGWAMAESFTGVRVSAADLETLAEVPSYRARSLVYP